jgi:copper(I)-binding protein
VRRGLIAAAALAALGVTFGVQQAEGGSGSLEVEDVSLPQPAGGASTASIYATIRNGTDTAVRLVGVVSDVGSGTSLMQEVTRGGSGYMTDIPSISVPAHGTVKLSPGVRHGMISAVKDLVIGSRVTLTFEFDRSTPIVVHTTVASR